MLKPSRAKRLSDLLPEALGPAAARQGFAGAEILARWQAIVGPEIAAVATPAKLASPPRAPAADPDQAPRATLILKVEGAFALEIQHRVGEILSRVNAHLGWPCVGAVKIRQGPTSASRARSRRPTLRPPTADEEREIDAATAAIEEDGLAEALGRLGRAALPRARG